MSDLLGGKHSKIHRSKRIVFICILQFSVCRVDSRLTQPTPIGTPPFGAMLVYTSGELDCRSQILLPSLVKAKRASSVFALPLKF